MATKEIETAPGATGCLARAADNEPLFILRAKDLLAPLAVRDWAKRADAAGVSQEKIAEALSLAREMEAWQEIYGKKVPD